MHLSCENKHCEKETGTRNTTQLLNFAKEVGWLHDEDE